MVSSMRAERILLDESKLSRRAREVISNADVAHYSSVTLTVSVLDRYRSITATHLIAC